MWVAVNEKIKLRFRARDIVVKQDVFGYFSYVTMVWLHSSVQPFIACNHFLKYNNFNRVLGPMRKLKSLVYPGIPSSNI